MQTLSIETPTHGRVVVRDVARAAGTIVAFHGYGHTAERMLEDVEKIPGGDRWRIVSVQALHRFYGRDNKTIMASWMTRQDREDAIADNIEYVNRVLDQCGSISEKLVYAGFSQGVAMAYRAALLGKYRGDILALGGNVPPEFRSGPARQWPRVLIGAGSTDIWYTDTKARADEAVLKAQGIDCQVVRFTGGHEWAPEFLSAAGQWMTT